MAHKCARGRDCEVPKQCQVNLLMQAAEPDLTLLREAGGYLLSGRLRESIYAARQFRNTCSKACLRRNRIATHEARLYMKLLVMQPERFAGGIVIPFRFTMPREAQARLRLDFSGSLVLGAGASSATITGASASCKRLRRMNWHTLM
jgi:hypothetical protein